MDVDKPGDGENHVVDRDASGAERPAGAEPRDISGSAIDPNQQHFSTGHLLNNLKRRTISSGVVTTAAQGVGFVLTIVSTMVLARLLTPRDFGLIAMVTAVMGFLQAFKDAGLSTATVQRKEITHAQVSNLFWINVGIGGASSLIVAIAAPVIAWFYRDSRLIGVTLALAFTFLLIGLTVQHMALLNRQLRLKMVAAIEVGSGLAALSVGVGMAWFKCGYWSLVGLQLTAPLMTLLLTWSACRWRPQRPSRGSGTMPLVRFGVDLTAASLVSSFARGADAVLIGRFFGAEALGLYSRAGALLRRPLDQFLNPIVSVAVPVLSRIQSEPERYRRMFLRVYEAMALISFLGSGVAVPLAQPLVLVLLGAQWGEAAGIFAGFAIAAMYAAVATTTYWLFTSQGRGRDLLVASTVTSALTVAAFIAGFPFGPIGMAYAFSVSGLLVRLPYMYYQVGRQGPVRTMDLWLRFFQHLPVWIVSLGATWVMRLLVKDSSPLMQLLICGPAGLLAGLAVTFSLRPTRRTALYMLTTMSEFFGRRRGVSEAHG
jgi:PST family polysaccharide transporter